MTLDQLIKYEIGPPFAYVIGAVMAVSALTIVTKVAVGSRPGLGWKRTSRASRVLDTAFAMFFLIRALMIFCGGTLSPIVLFLALAGAMREVNGFREYRRESHDLPKANVAIDNLMKMADPAEGFQQPA